MSLLKYVLGIAVATALVACGGGGGSAGTTGTGSTGGGTTGSTTVSGVPTMSLSVVDAAGTEITNHALSQTQAQFLKITLKDSAGAVAPFTRVTVALDSTTAVLVPSTGAQLTDSSGVVLMRIAPASVTSSGPVLATATATVNGVAVTPKTYELQISPGTVGLSALSVSPSTVQSGQSINVGLNVTVNGAAAPSNSVAVDFTSTCGSASPASALVDATGRATTVVQTSSTGDCVVSASAGGVSMSAPYTVTAPPITGIQFVSAAPVLIYQSGSAGVNTSMVKFKVIDAVGGGVAGVNVNASLTNSDGGINFCGAPSSAASASDGVVTFSVCAGTLPATVQVRAALDSPNSSVFTNSNLLTVQTGLPTQRFFDISATQLNFYAGGHFTSKFNGNSVQISVFAADRQGNPVPDGTKIVFVSEGGQINSSGLSSCLIASGRCSVDLIGQDYRPMGSAAAGGDPRPGRVTVLAYADGEEYFIDANNNNRYDDLELFEDLGTPFIDKDESGVFASAYTNLVTGTNEGEVTYPTPTGATGTSVCPVNSNVGLSVAGTCNDVWDGYTKVRRQIVIVFSGDAIGQPGSYSPTIPAAKQTAVLFASTSAVDVRLADYNGNPLPADASLSLEVIPTGASSCSATLLGSVIGSTTEPNTHTATLKDCVKDDVLRFKVTVSSGGADKISSFEVKVP